MQRRKLIEALAAWPLLPGVPAAAPRRTRNRPVGAAWPRASEWEALRERVHGNLIVPRSPFAACEPGGDAAACDALFRALKNPYLIRDHPALTQTCAWVGAWTTQPSAYAVVAQSAADVAAAVDFAQTHDLRLVIKGAGHSYLGASNAADSLLVWTRSLDSIVVHDSFVPAGGGQAEAVPAVTVGAGTIWMHVYDAVTTGAGRYVQGGGCGTVGVAGLVQGGGFGTHSKAFGTAGSSLMEAEIVTADGATRVVNANQDPELFWALKGGGGGSFGVLTRLTLRTWELPATFGVVNARIRARSEPAFARLMGAFVAFYAESLCNPHWGELVSAMPGHRLEIGMNFQGLSQAKAAAIWRPFFAWVEAQAELEMTPPSLLAGPGRMRWDAAKLQAMIPGAIRHDDRVSAPAGNIFWASNEAEAGHVIHDFQSIWLPAILLQPSRQADLTEALVSASRHWTVEMHVQKGLAGAPAGVRAAARDTPINPGAVDAFMLAIVASEGPPALPGLLGRAPDSAKAARDTDRIAQAMAALRRVAPDGGAYLAESSYWQQDWQRAYWGDNYPRLLDVKRRYDPTGLFFTRHGVGSEAWSEDGFTRAV